MIVMVVTVVMNGIVTSCSGGGGNSLSGRSEHGVNSNGGWSY